MPLKTTSTRSGGFRNRNTSNKITFLKKLHAKGSVNNSNVDNVTRMYTPPNLKHKKAILDMFIAGKMDINDAELRLFILTRRPTELTDAEFKELINKELYRKGNKHTNKHPTPSKAPSKTRAMNNAGAKNNSAMNNAGAKNNSAMNNAGAKNNSAMNNAGAKNNGNNAASKNNGNNAAAPKKAAKKAAPKKAAKKAAPKKAAKKAAKK
jgi:hypothetical protein